MSPIGDEVTKSPPPPASQASDSAPSNGLATSCNILAALLIASIWFTDTAFYRLCEITAASGLLLICHASLLYCSPTTQGLSSIILCFISGPLLFWSLLTFLW